MKHYYFDCTVNYRDNGTIEKWEGNETYNFIIEANKKDAKKYAEIEAINLFKSDFGTDLNQILSVYINDWYETSSDARAS